MLVGLNTMQSITRMLPSYLDEAILQNPSRRKFPPFDPARLLSTVFEPTQGCRVCILTDFQEPQELCEVFQEPGEFWVGFQEPEELWMICQEREAL